VARANQQNVIWDRAQRPWAIALYDSATRELQPLSDEQASKLLNRDPVIRREWAKWNKMSRNEGSLIVLDTERALHILAAATDEPDEDDEMKGLA
jgi:hypothetical protein